MKMNGFDYRNHQLNRLEEQVQRAEKLGINGIGLFNETGYYKWDKLHYISDSELAERITNMVWFLDGRDGWLANRLRR